MSRTSRLHELSRHGQSVWIDYLSRVHSVASLFVARVDGVVSTLKHERVEKFVRSFTELLEGVRAKQGQLVTSGASR